MELHAREGSITLDVTIEPARPRAGELVHFRVEATDAEGGLIQIGVSPGDGRSGSWPGRLIVDCAAPNPDSPPSERSPASRSEELTYAHRTAGERHFSVMVTTSACRRETHEARLSGTLTVLAGAATSNGPHVPEARVGQNREGSPPGGVTMSFGASDNDGVVRRVTVDWGDGSTSVIDVPRGERQCVNEPTAYPTSGDTHTLDHVYPSAGTYTVTAWIVSTGCDGKTEQYASAIGTAIVEAETG